jgi:hypothetical protein
MQADASQSHWVLVSVHQKTLVEIGFDPTIVFLRQISDALTWGVRVADLPAGGRTYQKRYSVAENRAFRETLENSDGNFPERIFFDSPSSYNAAPYMNVKSRTSD